MSKRTPGLEKRPRGFWPTPKEAVAPLVPFLPLRATYGEPCAGSYDLVQHLAELWPGGRCGWASDIQPEAPGIDQVNVFDIQRQYVDNLHLWITNPPWPEGGKRGDPAISIIEHLVGIAPAWILLPFDFAANAYFGRVESLCSDVLPIGRVSWLGNGLPGKDNAAWFRFDACNRAPVMLRARAVT